MLLKSNIPYTMVGGHKFYDRKEIKDILAYLSLIANPDDSISFERIVNEPKRGIGKSSIEKLRLFADTHGWAFWKLPKMLIWQIFQEKRVKSLVILA